MRYLKNAAKAGLCLLFAICLAFLVDGWWTKHLQKEIAPQIKAHFIPVDLDGAVSEAAVLHSKLSQLTAGKHIVGFGEATHGTAEFESAFSHIAKQLVKEHGFKVVVFAEMNFADTWALNEYVLHGQAEEMGRLHTPYGFIQRERLKLINWMHAYNKSKSEEEKVWILGADVNTPNEAARNALIYCEEKGIVLPPATRDALVSLVHTPLYSGAQAIRERTSVEDMLVRISPLYKLVEKNRRRQDSLDIREMWLVQSIANLDHAIKSYFSESETNDPYRDSTMFQNVKWVLERRPGAKMLVFAHNVHIQKKIGYKDVSPDVARLGGHLSKQYGAQFASIATEAWKGDYIYSENEDVTAIIERDSKIGEAIAQATDAPAGLLLLNETAELTRFFNKSHTISLGVASPAKMGSRTESLAEAYDAIFYVRKSTPLKVDKLYSFSLNYKLSNKGKGHVLQGNNLTISGTTSYNTLDTYQTKKGVNLYINYLDKERQLIDFEAVELVSGKKFKRKSSFPEKTVYAEFIFSGDKVEMFTLSDFNLNNVPIEAEELILEGGNYTKTSFEGKDTPVHKAIMVKVNFKPIYESGLARER